MRVVIVDYGMGNLGSVKKVLSETGVNALITEKVSEIQKADKIIFPGVGHFGECVKQLKKRKLVGILKDKVMADTPILGICIGMQLLLDESEEAPGVKGLGVVRGKVKRFKGRMVIPHMGWNKVKIVSDRRLPRCKLFKAIKTNQFFYFAHSYYCVPEKGAELAVTKYGKEYVSALCKGNIWAVQFHPEKSQSIGIAVIKNFIEFCG